MHEVKKQITYLKQVSLNIVDINNDLVNQLLNFMNYNDISTSANLNANPNPNPSSNPNSNSGIDTLLPAPAISVNHKEHESSSILYRSINFMVAQMKQVNNWLPAYYGNTNNSANNSVRPTP